MPSLRLLSVVIALTSLACGPAAPAWVLGPVPLAGGGTVAIGEPLPVAANASPWTNHVASRGVADTARVYRLQGSGAADVGAIHAEVSKSNIVTSLSYEVGPSVSYMEIVRRFRKRYGRADEECMTAKCVSWSTEEEKIFVRQRSYPEATTIFVMSKASTITLIRLVGSPLSYWPAEDYACRHGLMELCPP